MRVPQLISSVATFEVPKKIKFPVMDAQSSSNITTLKQDYVWIDCLAPGWQALVSVNKMDLEVPEPPAFVLEPSKASTDGSPKKRIVGPTRSTERTASSSPKILPPRKPWVGISASREESQSPLPKMYDEALPWENTLKKSNPSSPRDMTKPTSKNFVELNREVSRPTRRGKKELLEEASKQLRESEALGLSLAERLSEMQSKLTPT